MSRPTLDAPQPDHGRWFTEARPLHALSINWERHGCPIDPAYGSSVLRWLEEFGGGKVVGRLYAGGVLVRDSHPGGYRMWVLSDNGGEINVEAVNDPDSLRSVPFTSDADPVSAPTLAYRIHAAIRGQEIDYRLTLDELEADDAA